MLTTDSSADPDSSKNSAPTPAIDRNGTRVKVNELDARRVWVAAGGRCTFCKEFLASDETTGQAVFTGQLAHIVGATEQKRSPRGASSKTAKQRARPENLMLLCPGEHTVIDSPAHWSTYSEAQLQLLKQQHERDIRELTGLLRKPKSTVIRVAGDIRGCAVDFSEQSVIRVLLKQQLFPDFALHDGSHNCEVDLRTRDGEDDSDDSYWSSSVLTLERRMRTLNHHLKASRIDHISVFALSRIPLLVQLGVLLDDVTNVTVHNRRRGNGEGWGWYTETRTAELSFGVTEIPGVGDPVVTFSVSGPVDLAALPSQLEGKPRYDIRATGVELNPKALQSAFDLEALIDTWRQVLAALEEHHRNRPISLILAVSAAAAVEIGRAHMTGVHAPLKVFDRVDGTYALALEIE